MTWQVKGKLRIVYFDANENADVIITGEEFPVSLEDAAYGVITLLAIMESAETRTPVNIKTEF